MCYSCCLNHYWLLYSSDIISGIYSLIIVLSILARKIIGTNYFYFYFKPVF